MLGGGGSPELIGGKWRGVKESAPVPEVCATAIREGPFVFRPEGDTKVDPDSGGGECLVDAGCRRLSQTGRLADEMRVDRWSVPRRTGCSSTAGGAIVAGC